MSYDDVVIEIKIKYKGVKYRVDRIIPSIFFKHPHYKIDIFESCMKEIVHDISELFLKDVNKNEK